MTSPTTPRSHLAALVLLARSKTDFVFIFFILGTFLVLKGGWGTPKVGLVQKTIGKVIGRCVGNLGNIVCTSNPNNGQGHQNAQGLAAMRPRNSTLVWRVLGMLHRRISVYADCTPNQPARVVKPHGNHAQDTEGEVRGEFQPRRKLHIRQFRKYAGRLCCVGRF